MNKIATVVTATLALGATASAAPFKLTSSDFKDGGALAARQEFNSFGCTGGNVSPELEWSNAPTGTKSFVLMVHDRDAPTGSGFWHWVVYNIPATTTSLAAGVGTADGKLLPAGAVQGTTDFSSQGWGGPCPPAGSGVHHYDFFLYALKVDKLDVPANATAAFIGFNANGNMLGEAKLLGTYNRKK